MGYVTINVALLAFIVASIACVMKEIWKPEIIRRAALAIFIVGFALNTVLVINRWQAAGHAPFSNLYESLIFYAWSVGLVYLVLEYMYSLRIVGALAAVMIMMTLLYASTSDESIRPLMPALQSNWLTVHVINYFIGYAALGISFITAILYLVGRTRPSGTLIAADSGIDFSNLSYKIVAFGFPFLTLGMVTGAVWANKAWGTYWSWDPKETWSLITWLIYLVYLHSPLVLPKMQMISKERRPVVQSLCLIVAFLAVIFTYLGLSYLPSAADSAHVYQNQ